MFDALDGRVPFGRRADVVRATKDADRCAWLDGLGAFDGATMWRWPTRAAMLAAIAAEQQGPPPYRLAPCTNERAGGAS